MHQLHGTAAGWDHNGKKCRRSVVGLWAAAAGALAQTSDRRGGTMLRPTLRAGCVQGAWSSTGEPRTPAVGKSKMHRPGLHQRAPALTAPDGNRRGRGQFTSAPPWRMGGGPCGALQPGSLPGRRRTCRWRRRPAIHQCALLLTVQSVKDIYIPYTITFWGVAGSGEGDGAATRTLWISDGRVSDKSRTQLRLH